MVEKEDETLPAEGIHYKMEQIPLKDLPPIPFKLLQYGKRVKVEKLDGSLYQEILFEHKKEIIRYRVKIGPGYPGENDVEVWVVGKTIYIPAKWFATIELDLEFVEFSTTLGAI